MKNIIKWIKENPKLSILFTTDSLVLFSLIISLILTEFNEVLPAILVTTFGFIIKVINIIVNSGILNGRANVIELLSGNDVNTELEKIKSGDEESIEEIDLGIESSDNEA